MRRKALIGGILGITIGGAFLFAHFFLNSQLKLSAEQQLFPGKLIHKVNQLIKKSPDLHVQEFLDREKNSIGLVSDPDLIQARIVKFARSLSRSDLQKLAEKSLDSKLTNDERFLSVYILAESQKAEAVHLLMEIALTKISDKPKGYLAAEEQMIRAKAVESLEQYVAYEKAGEALRKIIANTQNRFLKDRALRAYYGWRKGDSENIHRQDTEALDQILKKGA